jgi:hypothetical protein
MALGDPILLNLSGATFLLTAETGVIIQSFERTVDSKIKEVFNAAVGATTGSVFYDFKAEADFNAILNGTTGVALAQPGVALTLANDLSVGGNKNGVNAGGVYVRSVKINHQGEDLRMVSGQTIQRGAIS